MMVLWLVSSLFDQCCWKPFLRMIHLIGLFNWLLEHPLVFHLNLLQTGLHQCSRGSLITWFHVSCNLLVIDTVPSKQIHGIDKYAANISYLKLVTLWKEHLGKTAEESKLLKGFTNFQAALCVMDVLSSQWFSVMGLSRYVHLCHNKQPEI